MNLYTIGGTHMINTEFYEEERDRAYLSGLVDNFEKINELSPNEKEQMRHDCTAEMARTRQNIVTLCDEKEKSDHGSGYL